jgi:hypothetical protein
MSANAEYFGEVYQPSDGGRRIVICADCSLSMGRDGKLDRMKSELARIAASHDGVRIIAIQSTPYVVSDVRAIAASGFTDISGALYLAAQSGPDKVIVVSDGCPNSETMGRGECAAHAFAAADYVYGLGAPVSTVFISSMPELADREFMRDLARRGRGQFFEGAAGDGSIARAVNAAAGRSSSAPPAVFTPADGSLMSNRDISRGTVDQLTAAAEELAAYRSRANARAGELSAAQQQNMHRLGGELLSGVHIQTELNAVLSELQERQHGEALSGALVSQIGALRRSLREQGAADRGTRGEECRAIEARLGEILNDFSEAVMNTARVEPEFRTLRGEYIAPRAAEMRQVEAWREPRAPEIVRRKPAPQISAAPQRFASLGTQLRAAALVALPARGRK